MNKNLITISFTPIDSLGGVPRWNRDFKKCFPETIHYSWWDFLKNQNKNDVNIPEWEKARILNNWLVFSGKRKKEDVVVGDGWWAGDFFHKNTISVSHGIWGHVTKKDIDNGVEPDFPFHHKNQIFYRKKFISKGGKLISVSKFISDQMKIQWKYDSEIINNSIDLTEFKFSDNFVPLNSDKKTIIHGVNDRNNPVKGIEFIDYCANKFKNENVEILSLDEAHKKYGGNKYNNVLLRAHLVILPSSFEGLSMFSLECLALGVPIVCYNVGAFWELREIGEYDVKKWILDRNLRNKVVFFNAAFNMLKISEKKDLRKYFRDLACLFSMDVFKEKWKNLLEKEYEFKVKS